MKTKNVILLGVVGVGAVGAYMYFSKKRKMNNLVASAQSQMIDSITPTTTSSTTTSSASTTPTLATQSDGVSPSDANLNLANATILVAERASLQSKIKAPLPNDTGSNSYSKRLLEALGLISISKKQLVELDVKLAKLGYKVDTTGALVKI